MGKDVWCAGRPTTACILVRVGGPTEPALVGHLPERRRLLLDSQTADLDLSTSCRPLRAFPGHVGCVPSEPTLTTATIETVPAPLQLRDRGAVGWRPAAPIITLDPTTLVAAYDAHRGAAYRLAYHILGDGPGAEDAVQDTFLKLWTGAAQFDASRGSMRGLLMTIARHTSIDVLRRSIRRQWSESTYCNDETYVTDGPEGATERTDEARHVRDALGALPGEQRRAIEMAYFAGLTCREIAAELTVPVGTVKSRMRLGMRKLALTLGEGVEVQPGCDGQPSRPADENRLRDMPPTTRRSETTCRKSPDA